MRSRTIEIVTFKLASGIDQATFLTHAEAASRFLAACPGFLGRRLSRGEGGDWTDHVEWETFDQAQEAARMFMEAKDLKSFMAAIDPGSVKMQHNTLMLASGA